MMNYRYEVIEANDNSNTKVNLARQTQNGEGLACYLIYEDEQLHTIQFEDYVPFPGVTLAESAQNDINRRMAQTASPQASQDVEARLARMQEQNDMAIAELTTLIAGLMEGNANV